MTRIAIGIIAALGIALAGTGWWLSNVISSRATVRASLHSALDANATLTTEHKRYKALAEAEAERAGQRQRERDGLAAQVATLRQRLGDGLGECKIGDDQLRAIDEFLKGGK